MNDILSVLDGFSIDSADDIAMKIANDFRARRIEKNLTREQVADKSGVAEIIRHFHCNVIYRLK